MKLLYLVLALALASCATETPLLTPADSLFTHAVGDTPTTTPSPLTLAGGGKYKFTGPVSIVMQAGAGNTNTSTAADNTKAGSRGGAAATAPAAQASAATKQGSLPWWVFALVGVGSVVGWELLSHKLSSLGWLPWRAQSG